MLLTLDRCVVRSWRASDVGSIARRANNRKIWRNLRDAFPHPYSVDDAKRFLDMVAQQEPETYFAIDVDGEAIGSIGVRLQSDVERCSAEVGCWVGESYWGRGIATAALRAITDYAMDTYSLTRVFAVPYEWNKASFRILEKAGFVLEGRMRRSAVKDGKVVDQLLYSYVREE